MKLQNSGIKEKWETEVDLFLKDTGHELQGLQFGKQ